MIAPILDRDRGRVRREAWSIAKLNIDENPRPQSSSASRHPDADPVQERALQGAEGRRGPQGRSSPLFWTATCEGLPGQPEPQPAARRQRGRGGGRTAIAARRQDELPPDDFVDGDELDIISPEELAASRRSMNLSELKHKPIPSCSKMAQSMGSRTSPARASRTSSSRS
jgi:hypothetical protein